MKLIIHDLIDPSFLQQIENKERQLISCKEPIKYCIGCFGCWVKTPGVCIIKDRYQDTAIKVGRCDELILVSQCVYGGQSALVKGVLDRSIGYMLPFFRIVNKEMHHKSRYKHQLTYKVYFYGKDISNEEKETAQRLVAAQAVNMHAKAFEVHFVNEIHDLLGVL